MREQAVNKKSREAAAVKVLDITCMDDLEEFVVEVNALKRVEHPGIVELKAAYFFNDKMYMVLELCSGGAFDDILEKVGGGLEEPEVRGIAAQVLPATAFIHGSNLYHRDIKSGNLLLLPSGVVKLTDFGSCSILKQSKAKSMTFVGSPYWMAPEVIACENGRSKSSYDSRADVWSCAITLIECAEGDAPWHDLHPMRAMIKIVRQPPPTLKPSRHWSEPFHEFLEAALIKDPITRPSAAALCGHHWIDGFSDWSPLAALYTRIGGGAGAPQRAQDGSAGEGFGDTGEAEDRPPSGDFGFEEAGGSGEEDGFGFS